MKLMNNNNFVVLALPPHTTHSMQPLDDIPFTNLKNEWYEVVCKFLCKYAAKKIAKYESFALFMPCWRKRITVKNIQAGFQHTGIWPVNRSVIDNDKVALGIILSKSN